MEQLSVVFNLLHPDLLESLAMIAPCSCQVCSYFLQNYIKQTALLPTETDLKSMGWSFKT